LRQPLNRPPAANMPEKPPWFQYRGELPPVRAQRAGGRLKRESRAISRAF
jgi:hypothetical protein